MITIVSYRVSKILSKISLKLHEKYKDQLLILFSTVNANHEHHDFSVQLYNIQTLRYWWYIAQPYFNKNINVS